MAQTDDDDMTALVMESALRVAARGGMPEMRPYTVLDDLCRPIRPGHVGHNDIFERDKKTETSTCRICEYKIKHTYSLRSTVHYAEHLEHVKKVLHVR